MKHICIICAIPQEIRPILHRFPAIKVACITDFTAWRFDAFGNKVTLIRSGIGKSKAARAASAAAALNPQTIISAGFCGALSPEAATGETFLAEKLYSYSSGSITSEITPDLELAARIGAGVRKATFITSDEIIDKAHISRLLPDPADVNLLDMESISIAEVCRSHGIKFAAIRSVSDRAEYDPCKLFRRICDNGFNISMVKLTASLIKNPSILLELLQLSKHAGIAGKSLARAIEQALERI